MKRRTSAVWDHFEQPDDEKKLRCKLCDVKLSFVGGTTVMHNHLQRKHPGVVAVDDEKWPTVHRQASLHEFVGGAFTAEKSGKLTDLLTEMLYTDLAPLSIVERPGFRKVIDFLTGGKYTMPSRSTFTRRLEKKYLEARAVLKAELPQQAAICLTTDAWSSLHMESFTTVTAHFIAGEWDLKEAVLSTAASEDRHTAVNIAGTLRAEADDFQVRRKVSACVHDNTANIKLAGSMLEAEDGWISVGCAAHLLQLAVNKGLDDVPAIQKALGAARRLVSHFKKSTVLTSALHQHQRAANSGELQLVSDCATRWNSIYEMAQRLIGEKEHVEKALKDVNRLDLKLRGERWDLLGELCKCLKVLQIATTTLGYSKQVSISIVQPLVQRLISFHLATYPEEEHAAVTKFKKIVQTQLMKRFPLPAGENAKENDGENADENASENAQLALLASALDPRYKLSEFLPKATQTLVWNKIKEEMPCEVTQPTSTPPGETANPPPKKKMKTDDYALDILFGDADEAAAANTVEGELASYQREPDANRSSEPLLWWKDNEKKYPRLAVLAKRYLCITATSVPSERVFSVAGHILNKRRSALSAEHADMLIFLHKNA